MGDIIVIGAGPAGVLAAIRAAELGPGRNTVLMSSGEFGGMAANDGPVPVRTLAHAARLIRQAGQFEQYGFAVSEAALNYPRLLARVHEVVKEVSSHSSLRQRLDSLRVIVHQHVGAARFVDANTVETKNGLRLRAGKFILCTGGVSRHLSVPGAELTSTHSDAWRLTSVPSSMLVIGAGATTVQVASIFSAFGSRVQLFHTGDRILRTEDEAVSAAVADGFRTAGIMVWDNVAIESFEKVQADVQMNFSHGGSRMTAQAAMIVVAVGWVANTAGLGLAQAGVEIDQRGFVRTDEFLRTTAPHIFAAGDITGRLMLVPQALQDGFVAATNAVCGPTMPLEERVNPSGGFTEPEYASVGLTEAKARTSHDVVTAVVNFDSTVRTIIDGWKFGFCKLIADRKSFKILGCHVVGQRASEIVQVAAIAMSANMRVDELAQVPLSFPTYTDILALVAADAARQLHLELNWQAHQGQSTFR